MSKLNNSKLRVRSSTSQKNIKRLKSFLYELNNGGDGLMQEWWDYPENILCVSYAELDNIKVGCAIYGDFDDYNIGVWVHPDFRKNGIGSKLIKKILKRIGNKELYCDYGACPELFRKFIKQN